MLRTADPSNGKYGRELMPSLSKLSTSHLRGTPKEVVPSLCAEALTEGKLYFVPKRKIMCMLKIALPILWYAVGGNSRSF